MFKVMVESAGDKPRIEFEVSRAEWQLAPQRYKLDTKGDGWVNVYHQDPLGGWKQVGLYRLHGEGVRAISKQFTLGFAEYLYTLTRRLRELAS